MSNYRRARQQGGCYFFTVVTHQRRQILLEETMRNALRQGIIETRQQHPFDIDAWVLLPDHLHCIWSLPAYDANFSIRWAKIKLYVSRRCGQLFYAEQAGLSKSKRHEASIWQRRYWEHQIRDEQDFEQHMHYLHWNPVKHGLVKQVIDWPYSSFHRYLNQGIYDTNWAGVAEEHGYGE